MKSKLQSMTGYGHADGEVDGVRLVVDARSVNSRSLDLQIRLPREYAQFEPRLRTDISNHFARGRIELSVSKTSLKVKLGRELIAKQQAKAALARYREIFATCKVPFDPQRALFEIISGSSSASECEHQGAISSRESRSLFELTAKALEGLLHARVKEGVSLAADLGRRLRAIASHAAKLEQLAAEQPKNVRGRLVDRIAEFELGAGLDVGRLEQEVAYFAERSDVSEEIVRLKIHLRMALVELAEDLPATLRDKEIEARCTELSRLIKKQSGATKGEDRLGRKLEFVNQEILREVNTIGSKSQDERISALVIESKSELEKLREQLQNLE